MPVAPLPQAPHVIRRREGRARTLVGFEQHSRYILGIDRLGIEAALEVVKGGIRSPKAVGKRDLREARIQIANPFFERWNTPGLLRAERPAMKSVAVGNDDVLGRS